MWSEQTQRVLNHHVEAISLEQQQGVALRSRIAVRASRPPPRIWRHTSVWRIPHGRAMPLYWPLQSSARSSHLMWSHARDVLAAALRRRLVAICIAEGTRRDTLGYHEGTLTDTTGDGRLPEHDHPGGVCARDRGP